MEQEKFMSPSEAPRKGGKLQENDKVLHKHVHKTLGCFVKSTKAPQTQGGRQEPENTL